MNRKKVQSRCRVDPQSGSAAILFGRVRAWRTGVPKSKDYVAGQAKLLNAAGMEKYHLCKVAEDGQRIEFKELVCRDDGHAVHLAKQVVQDHDVEVWNGNRYVFLLECKRR
jgi:hypothetical protein